jgi:hypothetical protein
LRVRGYISTARKNGLHIITALRDAIIGTPGPRRPGAGGLRRGSTMSVAGSTALVLALLAEATGEGSWAAITGMPDVGVVAAAELGVDLERLALVPDPGAEVAAVL